MALGLHGLRSHKMMCLSISPLITSILQCLHLEVWSAVALGKGGGGVVRAFVNAEVVGVALQKETEVQVCFCASYMPAACLVSHRNAVGAGVFQFQSGA